MKSNYWAVSIIFASMFTISSFKEEGKEFDYVINSMGFVVDWNTNQDVRIACHEESKTHHEEQAVSAVQVRELVENALIACALDGQLKVPVGVGRALFETAYVPTRAAIPYEMAKTALQGKKTKRCSNYITPLIAACPSLLKPYFKRSESIKAYSDVPQIEN